MVDPKSYELAEHFLAGLEPVTEAIKMGLAQHIQDAVEDWLSEAEEHLGVREAPDPDQHRDAAFDRELWAKDS